MSQPHHHMTVDIDFLRCRRISFRTTIRAFSLNKSRGYLLVHFMRLWFLTCRFIENLTRITARLTKMAGAYHYVAQ